MKNNLIRGMAIAILATSMSGFAQTSNSSSAQTGNTKKSRKNSETKKSSDQRSDNDQLLQIYG